MTGCWITLNFKLWWDGEDWVEDLHKAKNYYTAEVGKPARKKLIAEQKLDPNEVFVYTKKS